MNAENQKYEITGLTHPHYPWLRRIRALKDVREGVKAGTLGGYVESAENLSQGGMAWIADDAICCEGALVTGDACLTEKAIAKGSALVSGDAEVGDTCVIQDHASVMAGVLGRYTCICGNGCVLRNRVTGKAPWISGNIRVYGTVGGHVDICGDEIILPGTTIDNPTEDAIQLENEKVRVFSIKGGWEESPEQSREPEISQTKPPKDRGDAR